MKIEQKIEEYQKAYRREKYSSTGQLFIFFSGHGINRGENAYFMTSDANPRRPHATAFVLRTGDELIVGYALK